MQRKTTVLKYCAVLYALHIHAYLLVRECGESSDKSISRRQVMELHLQSTSEITEQKISDDTSDVRDKTWRQTNHIITQYRPDIEARLLSLTERKAHADDPEVIRLARDVIDPVPATIASGMRRSHPGLVKTPQVAEVEKIFNGTVNMHTIVPVV